MERAAQNAARHPKKAADSLFGDFFGDARDAAVPLV
jgi:hypothetical protein